MLHETYEIKNGDIRVLDGRVFVGMMPVESLNVCIDIDEKGNYLPTYSLFYAQEKGASHVFGGLNEEELFETIAKLAEKEPKKPFIAYEVHLTFYGTGIVESVNTPDYLRACYAFSDMIRKAMEEAYGDGVYQAVLTKTFFDAHGKPIRSVNFKRGIVSKEDEK